MDLDPYTPRLHWAGGSSQPWGVGKVCLPLSRLPSEGMPPSWVFILITWRAVECPRSSFIFQRTILCSEQGTPMRTKKTSFYLAPPAFFTSPRPVTWTDSLSLASCVFPLPLILLLTYIFALPRAIDFKIRNWTVMDAIAFIFIIILKVLYNTRRQENKVIC
uniref:uncharacterized protein LOC128932049 isoform X1 n=1 Tax=Callithrix jacchus TaxID=9483 RepID=UPI0023DD3505|nr:uncharacterized protein LOC128932049 isoform X1 [Callithrix jacchus]